MKGEQSYCLVRWQKSGIVERRKTQGFSCSMKVLQTLLIVLLIFVSCILALASFSVGSGKSIEHTLQNSREIEASFQKAKRFMDHFQTEKHRLPSVDEFKAWTDTFPFRPYTPNGMHLQHDRFSEEAVQKFGSPPSNAYLLLYWRGEWMEYYASWADRTSLEFDRSKYYLLKSRQADAAALALASLCVLWSGIVLKRRYL
jgi:hypothetical protein